MLNVSVCFRKITQENDSFMGHLSQTTQSILGPSNLEVHGDAHAFSAAMEDDRYDPHLLVMEAPSVRYQITPERVVLETYWEMMKRIPVFIFAERKQAQAWKLEKKEEWSQRRPNPIYNRLFLAKMAVLGVRVGQYEKDIMEALDDYQNFAKKALEKYPNNIVPGDQQKQSNQ